PLPPVQESEPDWEELPGLGSILVYKKPFTWTQDILIRPDVKPGPATLAFTVKVQVCNGNCIWGDHRFSETVDITDQPATALTPSLRERMNAATPPIRIVPLSSKPVADGAPGQGQLIAAK